MATFLVTLEERLRYTIEVEADDEDAAREAAEEAFTHSPKPYEEFDGECCDRYPVTTLEKTYAV